MKKDIPEVVMFFIEHSESLEEATATLIRISNGDSYYLDDAVENMNFLINTGVGITDRGKDKILEFAEDKEDKGLFDLYNSLKNNKK